MTRLRLRPAFDVKPPKMPPIPKAAMAAIDATKALWRSATAAGDVVAYVQGYETKGMRIVRDDRSILVANRKGELVTHFALEKKLDSDQFRHTMGAHPNGLRFLYAQNRVVYELDVTGEPTFDRRHTIRSGKFAPYEAVYLGDRVVCSSEDALYLLGADFELVQAVPAGDVGYFHLAAVRDLLIAATYDISTTPAGPHFEPDIVAYRLDGGALVEVARGKGPGREPFVVDDKLYLYHQRKVHEVLGLP